jgi:hypothetical protein
MTRRRWWLVVLAVVLAAAIAAGVLLVTARRGTLNYSVVARSEGHFVVTVTDSRAGKHTDWFILLNSPKAANRVLIRTYRDGSAGEHTSVSTSLRLPAGVHRWAIYDADLLYAPNNPRYWTADHRVAQGQVTVP